MSVIPFTTQIGPQVLSAQNSQTFLKVVLVYTDKMTERQSALMKECQDLLSQNLEILIKHSKEIEFLPPQMKFFVIPSSKEDLKKTIKNRFEKPIIYLPRAVIEARGYHKIELPVRNFAISLTMHNCKIFLVKTCDLVDIKKKIHEMCGHVVMHFGDEDLNVVVTDTADNKYCSRAFKRNIPVVSTRWIDDNFMVATEEENGFFNRDALSTIEEHQIKPFYGLHFKIMVSGASGAQVKKLITENQGHIIYGNENSLTHIVAPPGYDILDGYEQSDLSGCKSSQKPRVVDEEFLKVCIQSGYFLPKREYRELNMNSNDVVVKQEHKSQAFSMQVEENCIPPSSLNGYSVDAIENHQAMLPPPPIQSRPLKQQQPSNNMNDDMILKALSTFETAQTQLASTQMRRLPDPELRIEPSFEPSQQLFWNDSVSRRN